MKINISPNLEKIYSYRKKGNLIPVYLEIGSGIGTDVNCLENLISSGVKYPFIFESINPNSSVTSRYTFIGFNPIKTFTFKTKDICEIEDFKTGEKNIINYTEPFEILRQVQKKYKAIQLDNVPPLNSGLVGYFGFDLIQNLYKIPAHSNVTQEYPYGFFGLYKDFIVYDNYNQGKVQLITNIFIDNNDGDNEVKNKYKEAEIRLKNTLKIISKLLKHKPIILNQINSKKLGINSNLSNIEYGNILNKLKENLKKGEVFQTIISEIYKFDLKKLKNGNIIQGTDIYKTLRHVNPSSYMFYMNLGEFDIIGSVPEPFVKITGKNVLARPLAGTRGVGKNKKEFNLLKHELETDPKERAEHAMLIDLVRNDLSINCEPGTVKVKKKMYIKKYNHVMHIVSDVIGKIGKGKDYFDVVKGIFPHGNVTGAPKIQALKLINKYEPTNRGIYGGAIGYFGFDGNADFAVIIRTIIKKGNILYNQVGSGIVIDFVVENEIKEHENKNKTFKKVLDILYNNFG